MKINFKKAGLLLCSVLFVTIYGCGQKGGKTKSQKETKTIIGDFDSKMGVMHNISCYCFNVGFISTGDEKVVVCFDRMELEEKPPCDKIKVTGYFEKYQVEEDSKSPCPGGERDIFYAESYECAD